MNVFNIQRTYEDKVKRNWDTVYWSIDVHDVILEGKYSLMNEGANYLPNALNVLKMLSKKAGTVLILWTSSHPIATAKVLDDLEKQGVHFKFVNNNPECLDTKLCDFSSKFYFNILIDDKAGFEKDDWYLVEKELKRIGEWKE